MLGFRNVCLKRAHEVVLDTPSPIQAGRGQKEASYANQPILQIFHLQQGLASGRDKKRQLRGAENRCEKKPLDDGQPAPPPGRGSNKKSLICKTALLLLLLPGAVVAHTGVLLSTCTVVCTNLVGEGWGSTTQCSS